MIILPASGNGTFHARFGDAQALVKGNVSTRPRDGKTYLNVDNLDVDLRVKDVQMRVRKVFNNNRILSEYHAITSNSDKSLFPNLNSNHIIFFLKNENVKVENFHFPHFTVPEENSYDR